MTNGHNNNADIVARVDQSVICISSDDEDESSPQPKRQRLESPKIHIFKILILIEAPVESYEIVFKIFDTLSFKPEQAKLRKHLSLLK